MIELDGREMHPECLGAVIVPYRDESFHLQSCLDSLAVAAAALPDPRRIEFVLVDNGSTDASGFMAKQWRYNQSELVVHLAHEPTPGVGWARALGARIALTRAARWVPKQRFWLLGTDSDCIVSPDWLTGWQALTAGTTAQVLSGVADFGDALWHRYPVAERVNRAAAEYVKVLESVFGTINIHGNNHAIERAAYASIGPYSQPYIDTAEGRVNLAGEDWDMGTRARALGLTVQRVKSAVNASPRRFLADPVKMFTGEAYEGSFDKIEEAIVAPDVDRSREQFLIVRARRRLLLHFACKPILVDLVVRALTLSYVPSERRENWDHFCSRADNVSLYSDRNTFVLDVLLSFWSQNCDVVEDIVDSVAGQLYAQ